MSLFLTAREAKEIVETNKEIAETNLYDINTSILKCILEEVNTCAHRGETTVNSRWSFKDIADVRIVEQKLKDLGYKVKVDILMSKNTDNECIFSVSWDKEEKKKDLKLLATERWCSVSNAIIKKYKFMVENDKEDIVYNNTKILKHDLIEYYDFIEEDFENWE